MVAAASLAMWTEMLTAVAMAAAVDVVAGYQVHGLCHHHHDRQKQKNTSLTTTTTTTGLRRTADYIIACIFRDL